MANTRSSAACNPSRTWRWCAPSSRATASAWRSQTRNERRTAGDTLVVLIPSRDRHGALRRSLASIAPAAATAGAWILICDQSAQPFPDPGPWTVLHQPDLPGLPAARNRLMAAAPAADLYCFCDDDVDMAPDLLCQARQLARREPAVSAWGPVVETRSRGRRRLHRLLQLGAQRDPRRLLGRRADRDCPLLFGCAFVVRGQPARATGFDARRTGYALGEDADFFWRLPGRHALRRCLRLIHREEASGRADPHRRAAAKARWALHCARSRGGRNPASILHLGLALLAAGSGRGREPGSWGGLLQGLSPLPR